MNAASPSANARASGFLTLFGAVFAIPGAMVGVSTLRKLASGTTDAKQAVLGMTLAVMFVGAGSGLIVWSRLGARMAAKIREAMDRNPDRPWLWRDDWAEGYARTEWRSTAGMMTFIGVAFLLFSIPMLMNLELATLKRHPFQSSFIFLFPTVGLLLVAQSTVAYLRARKFKDVRLRFASVPCPLGGKLEGRVEAEFVFPSGATVDLKLDCIRSYVSGSGDSRSRGEQILWQEPQTVSATTDGRTSYVPVAFTVPYDAKETDARDPDDAILWRLTAESKLRGLDFRTIFEAPVFKTAASDATLTTKVIEARDEAQLGGERPVQSKIVTRTGADGGRVFYFGPARNVRAALLISVFGAIFLGAGLFFGFAVAQAFGWIVGAIPITVSGGIGLLLLGFSLWLWLGVTTVEVLNGELHIRSSCLGMSRSRVIRAAAIRELQLAPNLQAGEQVWYDLKLRLDDGRSVTAGGGLEKKEAEWLRGQLKSDLGIGS